METEPEPLHKPLLALAFWSIFALAILALLLSALLLLMITGADRSEGFPWGILAPLGYAALTWLYLDVISLEYRTPDAQRPLPWLIALCITGGAALTVYAAALLPQADGAAALFLLPLSIGFLAVWVVGSITLHTLTQRTRAANPPS